MGCGTSRSPVAGNTLPHPSNQGGQTEPYSKHSNLTPASNGEEDNRSSSSHPKPKKRGSDFDSITYAEAAASRAQTPEGMWAIVKKTCNSASSREWTLQSVKNRRGWKTIRLFVSSTFRDFHEEREVLVKEIFPDLRLWCEERKLHLVECDLRWGVPKDSSTEETVRICLEEIDRCYRDNVMPYFLNLTCGRSGWIPDFGDLTYNLAVQYGWVYGLSITEMEIVHGAFRKCNPNALFMIRDSKFCEDLPEEVKDAFIDEKDFLNEKLKKLKDALKEQFPDDNVVHYEVKCEPKSLTKVQETRDERDVRLKGLTGSDSVFYNSVFKFFKDRIEYQYPLDPTPEDPLEAQRSAHESFLDTRGQVVLGRDKILKEIDSYISTGQSRAPLLLVGNAGSGKSAIMARAACDALDKSSSRQYSSTGDTWKVFYHFVGATPGSTDLAFFLQRLTKELGSAKMDVVSDLDSLVQLTNSLLSNPNTKPAIIIVDAINQLDDDKIQYLTRWLPETLSPNIRVVLSMIDNTECHRLLRAFKTGPREILCGELDYSSRKAIVENILKLYNKRLDDQQMSLLLKKEGSANPLWLTLACEELRVFGHFNMMDEKISSLKNDLISLEEQLLTRFELENGGPIVIGTVCLLETSRHGLLETELLQMLADETNIIPPAYVEGDDEPTATQVQTNGDESGNTVSANLQKKVDETYVQKEKKDEDEEDEDGKNDKKDGRVENKKKVKTFLPAAKWALVYRALKPLLRPCGDLGEGRLDFYHRSISKAVRRKYFSGSDGYVKHMYAFWHGRHAEFFENCDDFDRKSEELPYHLEQLLDHNRLTRCLLDWEVFSRLYSEDFSIDLLRSWQRAGGYSSAALLYKEALQVLKKDEVPLEDYAHKMEMVINFLIQAGQYSESYEMLKERLEIEEKQLGARTEHLANIYHLMTKTKSEIVKNHNFVTMSQLEEDKEIVQIGNKSLSYRNKLQGEEHEHKKALMSILIAHHLSIVADLDRSQAESARKECFQMIDEAIAIFEKQGDMGHVAEAIMTKSFINPRHTRYFKEKEEMLQKAFELCLKTYGEKHMLMLRLYLNIGILYEDNRDLSKAYDYFVKWNETCMEVLGPSHPKTKRSKDTLEEAAYVRIREQRERQAAGTA
ncbi:TPR repeat-containing protein DDB_G0287407 isoform X2 [Nematostella vectensis]|uniref:TPR repeat-containing protein DDB_G0287407 isoform X2 n=1 Tax=Nematostella vectensis TaxID=45351 RepID=UPI0020778650|nr:TPR repeat-containing protein DDB_G0287407 isoform X2 [Nematostella vectensis]